MKALIVILCIIAFFVFLFTRKVWVKATFDEGVVASAGYWFIKFPLYPKPEKPEKKKKSNKGKEDETEPDASADDSSEPSSSEPLSENERPELPPPAEDKRPETEQTSVYPSSAEKAVPEITVKTETEEKPEPQADKETTPQSGDSVLTETQPDPSSETDTTTEERAEPETETKPETVESTEPEAKPAVTDVPAKSTKKVTPAKSSKKAESFPMQFYHYFGFDGIMKLLKDTFNALGGFLGAIFGNIVFNKLKLYISVGSSSPDKTAIQYSKVCAYVFPIMGKIVSSCKVKQYDCEIMPDFLHTDKYAVLDIDLYIRPIFVINGLIVMVFKLIAKVGIKLLKFIKA